MDYFAGLDISMDEIHVCVLDREGVVVHESNTEPTAQAVANELANAKLSSRRIRDGANGTDPVSRAEPTRSARGLRGKPAGLSGAQVARDPQDRSQRRARSGAFGPHRVLQARPRGVFARPRGPLADHRAQETGRPASDLGKSDPGFGGRVRNPAASRAHRSLHRSGSKEARGSPVCLPPWGSDCGANCREDGNCCDRHGREADGAGLGGLAPADDNPRRRPSDSARLCGRNRRSFAHPPIPRHRHLGLVPRRYQSGEVDYVGSISKCGDRRARTLLYEAANVMLTRYKGQLKLKGCGVGPEPARKQQNQPFKRSLSAQGRVGQSGGRPGKRRPPIPVSLRAAVCPRRRPSPRPSWRSRPQFRTAASILSRSTKSGPAIFAGQPLRAVNTVPPIVWIIHSYSARGTNSPRCCAISMASISVLALGARHSRPQPATCGSRPEDGPNILTDIRPDHNYHPDAVRKCPEPPAGRSSSERRRNASPTARRTPAPADAEPRPGADLRSSSPFRPLIHVLISPNSLCHKGFPRTNTIDMCRGAVPAFTPARRRTRVTPLWPPWLYPPCVEASQRSALRQDGASGGGSMPGQPGSRQPPREGERAT